MSTAKEPMLSKLHELLGEAAPSVDEVKELTQSLADALLRTLETQPTADQPTGKVVKDPMFAAPGASATASDDRTLALAGTLAHLNEKAARRLLDDFKTEAYNDWSAFDEAAKKPDPVPAPARAPLALPAPPAAAAPAPAPAAGGLYGGPNLFDAAAAPAPAPAPAAPAEPPPPVGPSAAEYLAALPAELRLLEYAHEQRLLLLRCIYQMLAIVYLDSGSLHNIVTGSVALLLQGNLPRRLLELLLDESFVCPAEQRLPQRLLGGQPPPEASLHPGVRVTISTAAGGFSVATLIEKSASGAWRVKLDQGALLDGVQRDRMRVRRLPLGPSQTPPSPRSLSPSPPVCSLSPLSRFSWLA